MLSYASLVRLTIALASAGAGAAHLSAATAHGDHALVLAFFVVAGALQLSWAVLVAGRPPGGLVLSAGALGHTAVIATWVVSRTGGFPGVPGADHAEPVGTKDAAATLLEVLVVAGAVALVVWERKPPGLPGRLVPARALAPLAVATAVIATPAVVLPSHRHAGHDAAVLDARLTSSELTETTERAEGISADVRYGPFVLPPASLGGIRHGNTVLRDVAKPCTDCYIVAARADLVYPDGTTANLDTGAMLHHAVWTRPAVDDTTCGRGSRIGSHGSRFFAAGNERTEMRLPPGFGYHVGTDPWNLIVEIMNHSDESKTLYVTLDVTYRPAEDGLLGVTPVWLDIDNCRDSEYSIPAGRSQRTWTWTSNLTGRVVAAGGHVHDGGVKTELTNETTGGSVCTSVAGYGSRPQYMGTVESMSTCVWDRLGVVRAGDRLAVTAHYDSSVPQDDVMGIMVALVHETADLSGGTPASRRPPPDPEPPPVHEH